MGGTLCKIGSPLLSFLLCSLCTPLQKEFDIHFKEKDIVAGKFDTFDDIIKLINKEIAYKTRGKEHA